MASYSFSRAELSMALWCMENMAGEFPSGKDPDFDSAMAKLDAATDTMPHGSVAELLFD